MKSNWKRIGMIAGLIALVGVVGLASVSFAQGPDEGSSWPFNFRERVHEAIASALGISVDEYDSTVQMAREQVLDEAVAEGWLTQEQADRIRERMEAGFGPGKLGGFARGFAKGYRMGGWMGGPENSLIAVAADQLDLSVKDLLAELRDGKTIAQVAEERGVEPQAIVEAFIAVRSETLSEAVADGRITQERADWMLEHMEEEATEHLNEPFPFGEGRGFGACQPGRSFGHGGRGFRPGGMDRFGAFQGQAE